MFPAVHCLNHNELKTSFAALRFLEGAKVMALHFSYGYRVCTRNKLTNRYILLTNDLNI